MLNPADDALLNDLLDGRLAAAAEQACVQRLEREPELREAYDELLRAREFLRSAPDPQPPADFGARVRAGLGAESPEGLAAGPLPADPVRSATTEIPRAWRRLMVVAYAAAALLVVAIGLVSLKRGQSSAPETVTTARVETSRAELRGRGANGAELQDAAESAATGSAAPGNAVAEHQNAGEKKLAAAVPLGVPSEPSALAPGLVERASERSKDKHAEPGVAGGDGETGGLAGRAGGGGAGGAAAGPRPSFGPGGAVPPGLRPPSDEARAAGAPAAPGALPTPVAPPVAPARPKAAAAPAAPAPVPQPSIGPGYGPVDVPTQDADAPTHPLADLLLLEAASAAEGRALVEQVLAGPGAATSDAKGFTRVRLRRADARTDALLLARLGVAPPPAAPAAPAAGGAAPAPDAQPKQPTAEGAAPGASTDVPPVLADFSRVLTPAEQARLEALLGALPPGRTHATGTDGASAPTPSSATPPAATAPPTSPPAAPAPAPRRVRVVILGVR